MNTQKLAALLETVRYGSISKAAEALGYTQSGLAYAINSLESELGLSVVIRDQSGIRLSPEGLTLLPCFEELIQCDRKVTQQVENLLHQRTGVLRIASYPNFADIVLPHILADFHTASPGVEINLCIGDRAEIVAWCQNGEVDFAFSGDLHLAGFQWVPLVHDPELAALPPDFPTESKTSLPMEVFTQHPFILPEYWEDEAEVARAIGEAGITPQFTVLGRDNAPVLGMVEKGIALTVLPEITLKACHCHVKTLPLDPPCERVLGVTYRPLGDRHGAAHRFLRCLRAWAKKQDAPNI